MAHKSKSAMMKRLYRERRDAGLVRISFWIPEETQQIVKDAVERVLDAWKRKKESFWK